MKLLDNYERSTGVAEKVTTDEVAENNAFLNAILDTQVMKVCNSSVHCVWLNPRYFCFKKKKDEMQKCCIP